ncbi:hypothetical protein BHE74_00054233 [Ensete ventricosum]|nr:hypothetical protein BHE74_00054233 [Ensete ventricosum]
MRQTAYIFRLGIDILVELPQVRCRDSAPDTARDVIGHGSVKKGIQRVFSRITRMSTREFNESFPALHACRRTQEDGHRNGGLQRTRRDTAITTQAQKLSEKYAPPDPPSSLFHRTNNTHTHSLSLALCRRIAINTHTIADTNTAHEPQCTYGSKNSSSRPHIPEIDGCISCEHFPQALLLRDSFIIIHMRGRGQGIGATPLTPTSYFTQELRCHCSQLTDPIRR